MLIEIDIWNFNLNIFWLWNFFTRIFFRHCDLIPIRIDMRYDPFEISEDFLISKKGFECVEIKSRSNSSSSIFGMDRVVQLDSVFEFLKTF